MDTLTLWIYLRTWIFTFGVLAYLFTGNLFYTWLLLVLSEGMQTLTVYVVPRAHDVTLPAVSGKSFFLVDVVLSAVMTIVASISTMLLFYTFDCVVVLGDNRAFAFVGLYLLLGIARFSLLLPGLYSYLGLVFAIVFSALFIAAMADRSFYSHSRTVAVSGAYVGIVAILAILYFFAVDTLVPAPTSKSRQGFLVAAYSFFFLYVVICAITYSVATERRSDRSFSHFVFH